MSGCGDGSRCLTIDEALQKAPVGKQQIELIVPTDCETANGTSYEEVPGQKAGRGGKARRQRGKRPEHGRPNIWRALVAEAIGTGLIVLFGCGAVCSSFSGAFKGIWQMAAVWGAGVALAIATTADASGAHLNPAITVAFWAVRPNVHGMNAARAFAYMLAQLVGAVSAAALNLIIHGSTISAFERAHGIERGEPESVRSAMAFGE